jgi:hypothetical protein
MKKPIVWRPSTAPEEWRGILTVKLPPETTLPPTPQEYQAALNLKVWGLVREEIAAAGADVREVGERIKAALPGAFVDLDEPSSWEDAILDSDQMMPLRGAVDLKREPAARPLLTKDELEEQAEMTLDDLLAVLGGDGGVRGADAGRPAGGSVTAAMAVTRPADYGKNNKVFTEEAAEKAREILRKKLAQLNGPVRPPG